MYDLGIASDEPTLERRLLMHIKNIPIMPLDSLEGYLGADLYESYMEALSDSNVSFGSNGDTLMTLAQFWEVAETTMEHYSEHVDAEVVAEWEGKLRGVIHFANEYISDHGLELNSVFISVGC
jgi:hypothetical protein